MKTTTACPPWCSKEHPDGVPPRSHTKAIGEVYMDFGSASVELVQSSELPDTPHVALSEYPDSGEPREIRLSETETKQLHAALGAALEKLSLVSAA
jgi:hypothetical protein